MNYKIFFLNNIDFFYVKYDNPLQPVHLLQTKIWNSKGKFILGQSKNGICIFLHHANLFP